jgi:uncharacterized membrane protein YhaH (DUF805 family)
MVLLEAWQTVVMKRYAQFDGRAGRAEFWWFALANLIVGGILSILGQVTFLFSIIYFVYSVALIVPGLAVGVRRLHDTNRSGWWLLLIFIPLVGAIVLIVFFATAGDAGSNTYGPPGPPFPQLVYN